MRKTVVNALAYASVPFMFGTDYHSPQLWMALGLMLAVHLNNNSEA